VISSRKLQLPAPLDEAADLLLEGIRTRVGSCAMSGSDISRSIGSPARFRVAKVSAST